MLSSLFASGELYISSIVDKITAQSYYNPHIVTLLNLILKGAEKNKKTNKIMKNFKDLTHSNLWQIPAPEGLYNKTFNDLFLYLLDKNLIALGLYRLMGASDNKFPYVFTNPDGTVITNKDRVFVLGEKIPKDLIIIGEDHSDYINPDLYKNQYAFGQNLEGAIVKDYYGLDDDEKQDKNEYKSDSEESIITKDANSKTGGKSGRTSPKIQFSKLGDHNLTEVGFAPQKDVKSNFDIKTKDTANIDKSSHKDTKTLAGSNYK